MKDFLLGDTSSSYARGITRIMTHFNFLIWHWTTAMSLCLFLYVTSSGMLMTENKKKMIKKLPSKQPNLSNRHNPIHIQRCQPTALVDKITAGQW